jgi:iron complex outermembrane receptor protein
MHSNAFHRLFIIATFIIHSSIYAAEDSPVEEVIVTADLTQSSLRALPSSVAVLSESLIKERAAHQIDELVMDSPNVNMSGGSNRSRHFQLRGIGEREQYSEPLNPSVGLLIDGMDFSNLGGTGLLYDVDQVEFLMGPQGTRYGSNALAGLINVSLKQPTEELHYGLDLGAENYSTQTIGTWLSGPLTKKTQARMSYFSNTSDGFFYNGHLQNPTNTRDEKNLRLIIRSDLNSDLQAKISAGKFHLDNGFDAFSLDNTRITLSDQPGRDTQISDYATLQLDYSGHNTIDTQLTIGMANSKTDYHYDEDWSYIGIHPWEYSSTDSYLRNYQTRSVELRFLNNDTNNFITSWVTGILWLNQKTELKREYTYLDSPYLNTHDISRVAFYADGSKYLSESIELEAGLRVEEMSLYFSDTQALKYSPNYRQVGGRIALNYFWNDKSMLYTSLSRGYKSGGFNIDNTLDNDLRLFEPETLWNLELGLKASWLDEKLKTGLAIFKMERNDVQINSSLLRVREDGSTAFISYTGNAAEGINSGLELSAQWQVSSLLTINTALGLLDTEYSDFINSRGLDLSGREQAHASPYQYSFAATAKLADTLRLNVSFQGRDGFYFSDGYNEKSDSYSLMNANLLWSHGAMEISVWGRNLLDKNYSVRGFFFGNDPRDGYSEKLYTQLGEPRRFGVSLQLQY